MKYILLVEDDAALRDGLSAALQSGSLVVHAAADLAGARRILRERSFDLL